jgi:NADH dehydrogenase FAD-containing subunit
VACLVGMCAGATGVGLDGMLAHWRVECMVRRSYAQRRRCAVHVVHAGTHCCAVGPSW